MKKLFSVLVIAILFFSIIFGYEVKAQENYKRIYVYSNGFSSEIPYNFVVDESLDNIVTKLYTQDGTKIHIYNQPVDNVGVQTYIKYSNKQINLGKGGVSLINKEKVKFENGATAYIYEYKRPIQKNISNDKNYYYEINEVYPKDKRVITFWLKTDEANFEYYKGVLNHIAKTTWQMEEHNDPYHPPYKTRSINIKGDKTTIDIPKDKMLWGIFHPHKLDKGNYVDEVSDIEQKLDWKFEFLMTYSDFRNNIPVEGVKNAYNDGRVMMLTMQPWFYGDRDSNIIIPQIINGEYDEYIKKWARDVKDIKEPIFIRFANEMNGDWDPWCAWFFAKDTDLYIEAWKRVYNIFKEEGANNALFVFNPHDRSYPNFKWNNAHLYYPGDEYVDWVGLTGYNNGTSFKGDVWREFDEIYYNNYNEYMKYYSNKPFMITEFSCNEVGGDKANWIREGFKKFVNMPNIKMAVWFDQVDMLWEYNIDSSPEAMDAFKESLRNPHFSTDSVSISQEINY
ncbi:glycoside hydrolase family 26 protein [Tepidibacter formicigenes]|jgi:beta-mannanase|uniref:Glycosyl hydrolase family 26 n=1 Tax=Tepidibacter formicigenes DSM 15518 TaxID=1123349 RepID=A0A1M6MRU7_9FIRM|nr:glycosyl hydrolase [Tepidibacter formicigenes]SHJ86191.1 Glycosyl hydrolase family 26 [Tepidibacter formicigenes DSM 15518]